MPRQFLPRESGAHRIACIALYRALLSQCPRIALPADLPSQGHVNPIKHFVRKQFRRHVHDTSPRIVVAALKAGYASEELLRTAADGNETSLSQVHALLWQMHHEREAARAACQRPISRAHLRPRVWPHPEAAKVLEARPVPQEKLGGSGRRRVPKLTSTGGIPFLRMGKPQSAFLGRMLRDMMSKKATAFREVGKMDWLVGMAEKENQFEGFVREQVRAELEDEDVDTDEDGDRGGDVTGEGVKGSRRRLAERGSGAREDWTLDMKSVKGTILTGAIKDQKKWLEIGIKMQGIAEAEKELWMKEREERRTAKWLAKVAKKQESHNKPVNTEG